MTDQRRPSRFLLWLFRKFCKPELHPYLEGDLIQHFKEKSARLGHRKAQWKLLKDVTMLFRPGIIRSPSLNQKINTSMFKHYFTIGIRSFKKDKLSFLVNLAGLTTGLTAVLLIYLWVDRELKMDGFHDHSDRLYQAFLNEPTPNGIDTDPSTQVLLAQTLMTEYPEVDEAVMVIPYSWFEGERFIVSDGGDKLFASKNQFASPGFFSLFSFPLISGTQEGILAEPNAVVISESLAMKLYNTTDAIGKRLDWLHSYYGGSYRVTGVFKALPQVSSMDFDAVFPFAVISDDEGEEWQGWTESDPYTYFSLKAGTDPNAFQQKLSTLVNGKNENLESSLMMQRYADTYLYDRYENGQHMAGRIQYVRLFAIVALLIFVVASLNFMIMATAKAGLRMKEIGIKKAMGAQRLSLIYQFFTESLMISIMAYGLALGLTKLVLPIFNQLAGHELGLNLSLQEWSLTFVLALFTAFLSGLYPALHLSGFRPVAALKGVIKSEVKGQLTRKSFVVAQFTVSLVLVIVTLVISAQIRHIQSKNLGFEKDNLVWFTMGSPADNEAQELSPQAIKGFLDQLSNVPGVVNSTNFAHHVLGAYGTTTGLNWAGQESKLLIAQVSGGHDLISTLGIDMAHGRPFSRDFATDQQKIILNETAIAQMGIDAPIGKTVNLWGEDREIIGICKDFHIDQLYQDIMPVFIKVDLGNFAPHVLVRMAPGDQKATLDRIEAVFSDYFLKGFPFEPRFLNDDYEQFYQQELRVGTFANYATGVAIFIACLGVFAFSGLTLRRRFKELAIRKVLGSGLWPLLVQVLKSFLQVLAVSASIAIPIGVILSQNWLDTFAFRIELSPWLILSALLLMFTLMMVSIAYHAISAIRVNVLEHLRHGD